MNLVDEAKRSINYQKEKVKALEELRDRQLDIAEKQQKLSDEIADSASRF